MEARYGATGAAKGSGQSGVLVRAGRVLCCCALLLGLAAGVEAVPRVLFLGSRSPLDGQERALLEGFRQGLAIEASQAVLTAEFLNHRTGLSERSGPLQAALLRERMQLRSADLVAVSGLPAASFARRFKKALFPETPIVVLGVSAWEVSREGPAMAGLPFVDYDDGVERTFGLMRRLLPDLEVLLFVGGFIPESETMWERLQELVRPFPQITLVSLRGQASGDLVDVLSRLPERGTAVFCSGLFHDEETAAGEGHDLLAELVGRVSRAPVFSPRHDLIVGYGAVGGCAVDSHLHGFRGGRAAARILGGLSPDIACASVRTEDAPLILNFQTLQRFGIDPGRIPADAEVFLRPAPLGEHLRPFLPFVLIVFGVFSILGAALYPNFRRRRMAEERLRLALEATEEGVWDWIPREGIIFFSETLRRMLAITEDDLRPFLADAVADRPVDMPAGVEVLIRAVELCRRDGVCDCEIAMWGNEDAPGRWVRVRGRAEVRPPGGALLRMTGTVSDITGFKEAERQLRNLNRRLDVLASTDALTGCLRRERCRKEILRRLEHREPEEPLCLAVLDMDNMKALNDSFGHLCGDEALLRLGGILRYAAGNEGVPGRWGGDEFLLALPYGLERSKDVLESVARAIAADPFLAEYGVTMSIGIARYRHGEGLDVLLERADEAMYRAKKAGRNRVFLEADDESKNVEKVQKRWSAQGKRSTFS